MRDLERRERLLLALLPGVALFALYVWGFRDPFVDERIEGPRTRLQRLAADAARSSPAAVEKLRRETDALERRREELEREREALRATWSPADRRAAAVARVSDLLEQAGLTLVHSTSEREASERPALPPPLVTLAQRMKRLGCGEPELWRFDLSGSYGALVDALGRLATLPLEETFCLPVTLRLARDGGATGGSRAVTLWVWI